MNNQREIYEALLAGEILIRKIHPQDRIVKFENGFIVDIGSGQDVDITSFYDCENWQIYKEPKWYENIPEGGVLCFVGDNDNSVSVGLVIGYDPEKTFKFRTKLCGWKVAKLLTKQEIQIFLSNAPGEDV